MTERPERLEGVAAGQTALLYANVPVSTAVSIVVAALLAYALLGQAAPVSIAGWFMVMVLVCSARLGLWALWRRCGAATSPAPPRPWQTRFDAGALAAGVAWGSAPLWIFPHDSLAHQVFMGFVLASVAAGGISTLAARQTSYLIFLAPTLLPYSIRLFYEGGELQIFMGLVFFLGLGFLHSNASRFEKVTVRALSLSVENQGLVEALRLALSAAERANAAKTQFLAKVSQDIRTPLSAIMGMADLLERSQLSPHQRRHAATITQSATSLRTMISDLLDITCIERGEFTIEPQPFDLRRCIEHAVEVCAGTGYRKGVELHLVVTDPLPLAVKGDAVRLQQVLVNLLSTTIDLVEIGQIMLQVDCRRCGSRDYDVSFSIIDNGLGLARKHLHRLLDPLTKAPSPSTGIEAGSDLGLAVTRHLLDLMGATVTISSEIGAGTTIRFTLPMAGITDSPVDIEGETAILSGRRILVVDDRDLARRAIMNHLRCASARIETACCEAEAMAKLRKAAHDGDPFDVAIMDRLRPRTGNLAFHRRILASQDTGSTKVIALMPTDSALDESLAAQFRPGSLLTKPIRRSSLLEAVEMALRPAREAAALATPSAAPAGSIANSHPTRADLDGLKVLVAEDNPINQEVALAYLQGFGCRSSLAANGLEAIEACERSTFDIVLMDCQMPEVDGLAAIRHIRAREKRLGLTPTPIVMVTANAFASDREQALSAGADDFLSKPYSEDQLLQLLASAARRRAA